MKNLTTALIQAKKEFKPITKNAINPFYHSKYATLDHILDCIEPALHKHGLALFQPVEITDKGMAVSTILIHVESGEQTKSSFLLPEEKKIQQIGSNITYARRYTLSPLIVVSTDEDDDGNTNNAQSDKSESWKSYQKRMLESNTEAELKEIGKELKSKKFSVDTMDFLKMCYTERLSEIKTKNENGKN